MPRKMSDLDTMPENMKQNKRIESKHDAGEPETKEGIESRHDAREPETKEGIESGNDVGEPETKMDRIRGRC